MSGQLILVIDDEEPVRLAVTDILAECDLAVITAEDGESGVALYRERQAEIQLVLLDLSMPGQSGEETLEQLRALEHGVRIHVAQACAPIPGGVDTPADLARVDALLRAHG